MQHLLVQLPISHSKELTKKHARSLPHIIREELRVELKILIYPSDRLLRFTRKRAPKRII